MRLATHTLCALRVSAFRPSGSRFPVLGYTHPVTREFGDVNYGCERASCVSAFGAGIARLAGPGGTEQSVGVPGIPGFVKRGKD